MKRSENVYIWSEGEVYNRQKRMDVESIVWCCESAVSM